MPELEFSPQTQYEMALLARLQQFEVTPERLREMVDLEALGLPEDIIPADAYVSEPREFDTDVIHDIAEYLIGDEELGDQFLSSEGDEVVNIGMFIYGFMHRFHDG